MNFENLKLLPLFLSISLTSALKGQRAVPEKKDNLIILTADTSESVNMDNFIIYLIDNGYTFSSIDKNYKIASTNEHQSQGGYQHKLNIRFKDSTIQIRVTCNMLLLGSTIGNYQTTWIDWEFAKSSTNIYNIHYRAFMPVLSRFRSKSVLFYNLQN